MTDEEWQDLINDIIKTQEEIKKEEKEIWHE